MAKRHTDALFFQEGACNPVAIINTMAEACQEISAEPEFRGTASYGEDAALRLMCHQLGSLLGGYDFYGSDFGRWELDISTYVKNNGNELMEKNWGKYRVSYAERFGFAEEE